MRFAGFGDSWFPKWEALGYTPHVLRRVRKWFDLLRLERRLFEECGSL